MLETNPFIIRSSVGIFIGAHPNLTQCQWFWYFISTDPNVYLGFCSSEVRSLKQRYRSCPPPFFHFSQILYSTIATCFPINLWCCSSYLLNTLHLCITSNATLVLQSSCSTSFLSLKIDFPGHLNKMLLTSTAFFIFHLYKSEVFK